MNTGEHREHVAKLHSTLKKCGCGFIGTKAQFYKHMDSQKTFYSILHNLEKFYVLHGEVPINQKEGDDWMNRKWLEGTPKGYND